MIILDDVLPSTVFNRLITLTVENPNFKWGVCRTATPMDDARSFFAESQPNSWEFDYFSVPLMTAMNRVQMRNSAWEKINLKEVLRIRFGLLNNGSTLEQCFFVSIDLRIIAYNVSGIGSPCFAKEFIFLPRCGGI